MAELFVTIEPSGGDYTSLSACESGENTAKDWVSDGDTGVWEVQGNWSGSPDSTATTIDGGTAGASNYVTIQADSANKAAAASSSLDTSIYIGPALDISDSFVRVIGLQFNSSMQMRDDCRIDSCKVISGAARALWPRGSGDTYALNCHASTSSGRGYEHDTSGDSLLYNCTVLDCPENIRIDAGTCKAINCLAQGAFVGDDFAENGGTFTSSSNNCSEDTSAPGTSAITSATVSFVSGAEVNSSDSTGVIGGGTDLSGDSTLPVTVDIEGTSRAASPTIGAFEVVTGLTVSPSLLDAGATFPSASVEVNIATGTPFGGATFFSPLVAEPQQLTMDTLASTTALPSASVELNIAPSFLASAFSAPNPTVVGTQTVTMDTLASTTTLPSSSVELNIAAGLLPSSTALPSPTVLTGILLSLLDAAATLPSGSVELNIDLSMLASATTLPSPTVEEVIFGYVNHATYDSNGATQQTLHDVTMPSSQVEGNLLIAFCATSGGGSPEDILGAGGAGTPPSGWFELPNNPVNTTTVNDTPTRARVFYRLIPNGGVGSTVEFELVDSDFLNVVTAQYANTVIVGDNFGTGTSDTPQSPSVTFSDSEVEVVRWLIADEQVASAPGVYPASHNQRVLLMSDLSTTALADTTDTSSPSGTADWDLTATPDEEWIAGTILLATHGQLLMDTLASSTALPSPDVELNIAPSLLDSGATFPSAAVNLSVLLETLASSTAFNDPTVVNTANTISPSFLASATTLPSPTLLLHLLIELSLLGSNTTLPSFNVSLDGTVSMGESGGDMAVSLGESGGDMAVSFGESGGDF